MEVYGACACLLGMQINFPQLAKGIGLNEVSLIMNVKSMIYRMALEVTHKAGYVNNCHARTLPFDCAPF
jgi:hypothetical protein